MEKILYMALPMCLLLNLFIKKEDKTINVIRKYLNLCLINNVICIIILTIYDEGLLVLSYTFDFILKYVFLSLIVGLLMAVAYNFVKNKLEIRLEVRNEKNKD